MLRDAAQPVYEYFFVNKLAELAECDAERMAATHRVAPYGRHPDELSRVLNVFRSKATLGKYVIVKRAAGIGWSLARLTGDRDKGPVAMETAVYASVEDAEHAVFLARLEDAKHAAGEVST